MNTEGTVIKSTGSWYSVRTDAGEVYACRIRGKIRLQGIRTTNPVAVGDRVEIEIRAEEAPLIMRICPRKNYIIRRSTNLSKEAHILAANVDQAMVVVTVRYPETSTVFIDRFLASAEAYTIPAVIVFNKTDLYGEEEYLVMEMLAEMYEKIGYRCLRVSAETGEGVAEVREALTGKITMLAGLSGVGKSTLINRVEPGLDLKTAAISESHDTGKHTTTFAEMFPLSFGGFIVDTPGIRAFGLVYMDKQEISHYFPELFAASAQCRYGNCTHTHEPGCAVMEGVETGDISELRYASYLSMFEESGEKYR